MFAGFLSTVPIGTANLLAYSMMVLVAIFLIFGPTVYYIYWRQSKKSKSAESAEPPTGTV
ncbi:MAG: hypothetical protein JRN28_02150 [Nitrososphaerota archaeon]|nr:hypothetical protein [Nitrososphaerota archaeon]